MNDHDFTQYDRQQLESAKQILLRIYEYHDGDGKMQEKINRLATIIYKIDTLIKM